MFTPNGKTEIPFEIPLKPKGNRPLYETYHGVFVNVQVSPDFLISLQQQPSSKAVEHLALYEASSHFQPFKVHSE